MRHRNVADRSASAELVDRAVAWGEREETIGAVEHDRAPRRDQAAAIDERGLPFDRTVSADREKR